MPQTLPNYPQLIQAAIAQQLAPLLTEGVDVLEVADRDDAGARRMKRVMVAYVGSDYSPPGEGSLQASLVQIRTLDFEIALQIQNCKTFEDGYPYLKQVLELLAAYQPLDTVPRRLYPTSDSIESLVDGVHTWVFAFAINVPMIFDQN